MSKELVIGSNRHETKVAILEEDQLVEIYFQRGNEYSLAGSIHKGRVTRVLPGMQSAFVDLGLERDTFLYVSDFFEEHDDIDTVSDEPSARPERRDSRRGTERITSDRNQGDRSQGERTQTTRQNANRDRVPAEQIGESPFDAADLDRSNDLALPTDEVRVASSGPAFSDREEDVELEEASPESGAIAAEGTRIEGEANRGDRGGDRGNRRSRRRRPRGRGFPDNKYAQVPSAPGAHEPTGASSAISTASAERPPLERLPGEKIGGDRPSFERAYADRSSLDRVPANERPAADGGRRREEPAAFEPADPSDVIILPGESLAKYRRPATQVQRSSAERPALFESSLIEPSVEQREQIESETPRFHVSDSSVHPGLEQLDPVRQTSVLPAVTVPNTLQPDDVSPEEPSQPTLPADDAIAVEELAAEQAAIKEEAEELELADLVFSHHELQEIPEDEKLADIQIERIEPAGTADPSVPLPQGENLSETEHEEFALPFESTGAVDTIGPMVVMTERLTTFEATAPLGLKPEGEVEEDEEDEAGFPETEEPLSGEARVSEPSQTANLRDPGGRSLHRGSRRNRRRRGGSRSANPTDLISGNPVAPLSLGAGTATALEPVEVRREAIEVRPEARPERAERVMPSISDLLKAGQEIIVQIAKEPLGQKGARITSHIALPGRYVVFMPSVTHLGVSRKVASDEERQRLKQILQKHRVGTTGGFIVRTAGEGVPEEEIAADMNFLYNLWLDIRQKAEKKPAPALLHYDLDIVQRILRDHVTDDFKAIWVDNEDLYESILTFMQRFQPTLVSRVKMYTREAPIFDAFNITQELEKALRPKVWLKSGGYIVINQTEALVAIDINTGKYVGKSNRLEDTIVKTNTEAVKEIVRQIRLRDLGGIIVVDFIDMDERKNRQKVMTALEEAMESDKAPYKILQFNDFGLVAITRKRVKQSLERTLCAPCPYCEGAGYVKSVQTTIGEILVEAQKIARAIDGKDVVLRVHPEVAKVLKASNNKFLEEIEEILQRPVLVAGDAALHTEKFDLA